ncbi:Arm DNA-binding domain-containing protein, partial [Rhizobium johnstonii]|uniref:Arm DNA-binding domain-containing protein n=1 Tax=Rhizobium johnstonii TaxID=3019933 RepID=UPI003F9EA661
PKESLSFGVKVTPAGRKVFGLKTRLNVRPRRYTIGTYGIPWSPDTARAEASKVFIPMERVF